MIYTSTLTHISPLAVRTSFGDIGVGLNRPLALIALPVAVVVVIGLIRYRASGTASARSRRLLAVSRIIVIALLILAAAGPFTVITMETTGDPSVSLLVDRSNSTAVGPNQTEELVEGIEDEGIPATVSTIARGERSPIGDGVAANLQENGSVVVVSDGQTTDGQSLSATAEFARSVDATISSVTFESTKTERYITLTGPSKTSVGVESQILTRVRGVEATDPVTVTVSIDGEQVTEETLDNGTGRVPVRHTFESVGAHEITATIESDDTYSENNIARSTVRVVEKPTILYVSQQDYPLQSYLQQLYTVETANEVPETLDPYYAVVVQDTAADDLGNVERLQRFVIDGNGLLMVGGPNGFEGGGYDSSSIGTILPVQVGEGTPGSARVVLAIDASGSTGSGMQIQKAVALSALDQLGDSTGVGVVGFRRQAYAVSELKQLTENRDATRQRIRQLRAGGGTNIANGLRGAEEMLNGQRGTVILISDGVDAQSRATVVAESLGRQGVRVITVGAGQRVNEPLLQQIADISGGTYFQANETDRLRILFGGSGRQFDGEGLTIVDSGHFITSGTEVTATPDQVNDVSVRPGGTFLVAGSNGDPAVAAWRYGLGRVATITTYQSGGGLGGLLNEPDSLLVTKSVNYAIGNPERKTTGITGAEDTRVGSPATITYRGDAPPADASISFRAVRDGVYRASVTPETQGFKQASGATYAANYAAEYAGFGTAPALRDAVRSTDGRQFEPSDTAEIAEFARQQSTRVRDVEQQWGWVFVTLGLIVFVTEVVIRRVQIYQGRTRQESGLT
jgi:Mg-chelatase subunit ChlD